MITREDLDRARNAAGGCVLNVVAIRRALGSIGETKETQAVRAELTELVAGLARMVSEAAKLCDQDEPFECLVLANGGIEMPAGVLTWHGFATDDATHIVGAAIECAVGRTAMQERLEEVWGWDADPYEGAKAILKAAPKGLWRKVAKMIPAEGCTEATIEDIYKEWARAVAALPSGTDTAPAYRGGGVLRVDGQPYRLEGQEQEVIQALVELGACTKAELERRSNVPDAVRVLRSVVAKYKLDGVVFMPRGRGQGGYRTTITDARD